MMEKYNLYQIRNERTPKGDGNISFIATPNDISLYIRNERTPKGDGNLYSQ